MQKPRKKNERKEKSKLQSERIDDWMFCIDDFSLLRNQRYKKKLLEVSPLS